MRPITVTIIILTLLILSFFIIKPILLPVEKAELPETLSNIPEQEKNLTEEPEKPSCLDECQTEICIGYNYFECSTNKEGCKQKIEKRLVKGKCNVECFLNSDCKQDQECSAYKCVVKKSETSLDDFPEPFLENTIIIVGAIAPSTDVISSMEIATALQKETDGVIPQKLDSDVTESESNLNLIILGSPCDNKFVEKIFGITCDGWVLEEGKALIKITANDDNTAMLIAGNSSQDTLRAAKMVAAYSSNDLKGMEMII